MTWQGALPASICVQQCPGVLVSVVGVSAARTAGGGRGCGGRECLGKIAADAR